MPDDDLARFRTDDPASVAETMARCDKPDLLLRIAFQCTEDRRYVLRCGADNAKTFRTGVTEMMWNVSPWPDRLEVIELWAGGNDGDTPMKDRMRARFIATVLAFPLVFLGDQLVYGHYLADGQRAGLAQGLVVLLGIVFAPVAALLWKWGLQRQTRFLDEQRALEILAERLATFARRNPARTPWVLYLMHRYYSDLLPEDGVPDTFPWPEIFPIKLGRNRRWAAAFDSVDAARGVVYYRIQVFKRRKLETQFMAELALDIPKLEEIKRFRIVRDALRPIAESGKTNTAFVGAITA